MSLLAVVSEKFSCLYLYMDRIPHIFLFALLLIITIFFSSCNIPKDIHGTLDRINKDKLLRVGYSNHPPFIQIKNGDTSGIEYNIISDFGKRKGFKVEFTEDTEAVLMEKLGKYEIDIVIAGLNSDSPWKSNVAFTQPYAKINNEEYSIAVPPGENAFLVYLEKFLIENKEQIKGWVDGKP